MPRLLADVLAPFTGIVISRAYRGGEDVARGEVLAQLTDITNMEVRAFVPLKHLPRTVVGEPIRVFATDAVYEGKIRSLVPMADEVANGEKGEGEEPCQQPSTGCCVSVCSSSPGRHYSSSQRYCQGYAFDPAVHWARVHTQ